ncbi:phosphotransferase [Salipiger bermudensis]|uniref:phosphotransferase n=1 Tax=Salipiger bermudensis TaxID=344736 RepID=UPI001CD624F9|nr:phosphotransferase [Salipiger bermudensis]MCA0962757.1 aminoglycoside phosphotransferase family protein [Salipiger bermudensis]
MEMRGGDLEAAALALWPDLAREMGEKAGLWRAAPLARREDARVARVLLRLDGPEGRRLVLKHQALPLAPDKFADGIAAHMAVQEVWPEGLPLMRSVDLARQACVMDYLPARPLSVLLDGAPLADQAALLRRAGAWMAGFHRALPGEARVFQPKFTIRFLRSVMGELRAGDRQVAEPERFLACAEALCAMQPRFEGQETVTAQTHGDLHQRNLVLDETRCWGVDFAGGRVVPVGHDIARLLTDYAILHAPKEAIPAGHVLPPEALAGFIEGYGLVGPDDPSVQLLLRNRVLAEWWGLPSREAERSRAQVRRFARLTALAERVFG